MVGFCKSGRTLIKNDQLKAAIILSLPALIGLVLFRYWPMLEAFRLSFYKVNIISGNRDWIGFTNYSEVLRDKIFYRSLWITSRFLILKVPFQMTAALLLALLVKKQWTGVKIFRSLILIPVITSMVVVTTIWGLMYHSTIGLFNSILTAMGVPPQPFLTSPNQALLSIAVMTIWKDVGFSMIFYLAGLLGIPGSYYEAARLDGANRMQILHFITIPLLKGTNLFILLTETISAFKVFIPVLLLTNGGPVNSTKVIVLNIYENAFKYNRMGYASTISVLLFLILLTISLVQIRLTADKSE
ncbi:MAG: sugar ABC transporter permease [Spirochaetota bacterium]